VTDESAVNYDDPPPEMDKVDIDELTNEIVTNVYHRCATCQ